MKTTRKNAAAAVHSTDVATYQLPTRDAAWAFMRACEAAGLGVGFPGLRTYTVPVGIRTNDERAIADSLANGAHVVAYAFAGSLVVYS